MGNNDFEKGTSNLSPFLEDLKTTILASNVIINSEEAKKKIQKSVVFNIGKVNVGIVGYLTPESNILDSTSNVEYIEEILALQDEVNKLQSQGIKIIIALGHTDLKKNLEIANEVEGIDLIISGYKNSFFWNGTSADANEEPLQPVAVTRKSGKQVPIVQSHAYNKYLGKIFAKFDSDGEIIEYDFDLILLDASIPQNKEASIMIQNYASDVKSTSEVVGTTAVVLDGQSCRLEECNLGNLVLDSIIYYYATRFEGERWTDAAIAIAPGSTFASTISPPNRPSAVTRGDLLAAMPESENLVAVTMDGVTLMSVLEHSVETFTWNNPTGQFLQFAGIRVVYDFAKDPGERVVSAVVRCWNCFVPEFFTIDDWRDYKILMPSSLADGKHGYSMLVGLPRENLAYDAVTCTSEFIKLRSPVYPDVAGRITLVNTESVPDSASRLGFSLALLSPLLVYLLHN